MVRSLVVPTYAWKPKILGLSPAANYVQRRALYSNFSANFLMYVERVKVVVRT